MNKYIKTIGVLALVGVFGLAKPLGQSADTVKIGILHSLSGTMAISETSLRDVVLMAAEEINKKGGVLGKQIEPVVVDPASNWPLFAEKAKQLITQDKVAVTFGCWTSVSRKSCLPVFEEYNQLLFYPGPVRGRGAVAERVLHGGITESAAHPGCGIHDGRVGYEEVLPARHRLRLPAHGEQGAQGVPFEQGRAGGQHHGGVHAVSPSGLPDDCRQRSKSSPLPEMPVCFPQSTATATCPSTRSSPIRDCPRTTARSWPSRLRRTSCARWTCRR